MPDILRLNIVALEASLAQFYPCNLGLYHAGTLFRPLNRRTQLQIQIDYSGESFFHCSLNFDDGGIELHSTITIEFGS